MGGQPQIIGVLSLAAWRKWREQLGSRFVLGVGYVVAFLLTATVVYLSSRAPDAGPVGPASRTILAVVLANLVLIVALVASAAWSVVRLIRDQTRDAGAKLHLRFVSLFALVAFVPAIVVAAFCGVLVTRGVDSWFSKRVRTVVENSATVAKSYVNEKQNALYGDLLAMATDLNQAEPLFRTSPLAYSRILEGQAVARPFPAAYLIDDEGRILASAESDRAPPFLTPPKETLASLSRGEVDVVEKTFEQSDEIRGLARLRAYKDAYLYVVRRVEPGILNHLLSASGALTAYKDADANRRQIQVTFILTYLETVLLVLVGAVWIGMGAATTISGPVAGLVAVAHRVAGGDLSARVDAHNHPQEIAVLSHAFNKMTGDLQAQQAALRAASVEAESRREFIETVLAGVSAGVLSLDPSGRISAANQQAHALLGLVGDAHGLLLADVASELQGVAATVARAGGEAEEELDLVRSGETLRLRVRASGTAEGGLVLTFDDITRLVTAQRSAAWRDVARRIAHEIKNPLTPIQLSAERLRRKYRSEIHSDVETFDRCTETIIRQVGDIGRMVDEFSAFARMPAPKFETHSANELLPGGVRSAGGQSRGRHRPGRAGSRRPAGLRRPHGGPGADQPVQERLRGDRHAPEGRFVAEGATDRPADSGRSRRRLRGRGQRRRPADGQPRPVDRTLCDDAGEGHGPGPRHRQKNPGGARGRASASGRGQEAWRARGAEISAGSGGESHRVRRRDHSVRE